jgi:hypothetical protein
VETVADIARARAEKAQALAALPVKPLRNLEYLAAGELARWIKLTTPNDRTRVIRMLRQCAALLEDELQRGRQHERGQRSAAACRRLPRRRSPSVG